MAANPSIDWAVARKKGALIYPGELLEIPPVFEEAKAQNRPVPRAQVVDLKSFYGEKGRGGRLLFGTVYNKRIRDFWVGPTAFRASNLTDKQGEDSNNSNFGKGKFHQRGGLIVLGDFDWEPREHARYTEGRPVDMSYSSVQESILGWLVGLSKPQSNPRDWSSGDTLIINWNYQQVPALTIMNISDGDTTFTPIYDGVTPPYWYKHPTAHDYYNRIK